MKNSKFIVKTILCLILLSLSSNLFAQQTIAVSGTVTDETGETLIGASVLVKGTRNGTVTDIDGKYQLTCPPNAVLRVSYISYEEKEISIDGHSVVNIQLTSNSHQLSEVVVSVAYGTQKKVTLTGAVSVVGGDDLIKMPVANVANMLSGTMPGISTISYSGQPGADNPEIFIRGVSTFNSDASQPLFLIDGVERDFFQLDPNEIESITILKDASVTAVYGIRGANGVILVTTKRGVEGRAKISASVSYGVQQATRLLDFANAYEYALYQDEMNYNDYGTYLYRKGASVADDLADSSTPLFQIKNHTNPYIYSDTDWMDMLLVDLAPQTISNVNVSGGTKKVRYFTSVGLLTQDGIFKNFDTSYNGNFYYNRYNYRTNLDVDFTETSTLLLNLGGRLEVRNQPKSSEDQNQLWRKIYWATPLSGPGIVNGKWIKANSLYVPSVAADALSEYYGRGFTNTTENVLNLDLAFKQDLKMLTPGLKFNIKGAYNSGNVYKVARNSSIESYMPTKLSDLSEWLDPATVPADEIIYLNGEPGVLVQDGTRGSLSYSNDNDDDNRRWRNWYVEASLSYARTFDKKHDVSAVLVANQNVKFYPSGDYKGTPNCYQGLVGRGTYNYKSRYLADISLGYNGSENFAPGLRFGYFPAGSIGWIISEEDFFKATDAVPFLKLRASYGIVGNDRVSSSDRFLYLPSTWERQSGSQNRGDLAGYAYNFGTGSYMAPGASELLLANPIVTWEKAYKQDYGVDFTLLDNKFSGTVDYYYENREDILWTAENASALNGMSLPKLNLGKMRNSGVEFDLKWSDKINSDLIYAVKFNAAYTKNVIVYKDEVLSEYPWANETGHSRDQNFGYEVLGYYDARDGSVWWDGKKVDDGSSIADQSGFALQSGDVVYKDLNNDGTIDYNDVTALGYPNYPLLNGGLTLEVKWKGFDFSVLFTGAALTSRLLTSTYRRPTDETGGRALMQFQYDNRWTSSETTNENTLPRASQLSGSNNYAASSLFIRDASYLRLKNFQIGYNFSGKWMKTLGLKQFRVYSTGYNIFTWSKLKVLDPEMYTRERSDYPVMRIINFGINATF
ncbi:MAG: TonB-dependent receptor [Bacteroidales bacterium]|jgi:TonB-linked SusC/RagA family outer membrane protein|nr:TonB-dependent receptor [Bacteroidales bacterium]